MKKLKRNQISELRKTVPMLDSKELSSIIGGDKYYFDESGHLINREESLENVIYIGDKSMSLSGTLDGLESADGSGILFSGDGVSSQLFEFMAENTNVEWAYGYNSTASGGMMGSSHQNHSVDLSNGDWDSYDSFVHNHANDGSVLSEDELREFNSLPSQADIENLKKSGRESAQIYNETTGRFVTYTKYSTTQEDWLRDHDYNFSN
jgi:hypothetical protein